MSKFYILHFTLALVFLALMIIFYPLGLYAKGFIMPSFIVSIVFTALLYFGFNSLEKNNKNIGKDYNENSWALWSSILLVVGFILSAAIFIFGMGSRKDAQIEKNGIFTKAIVVDGYSERSRRTNTNMVTIEFIAEDGTKHRHERDVITSVYSNVAIGQQIEIKYLKQDPSVFDFVVGDKNTKKYKNVPNRDLEFSDLEAFLSLDGNDISEYVNKISLGWQTNEDASNFYFMNTAKGETFSKRKDSPTLFFSRKAAFDAKTFIPRHRITSEEDLERSSGLMISKKFMLDTLQVNYNLEMAGSVTSSLILSYKK